MTARRADGVGPDLVRLVERGWADPRTGFWQASPIETLVVGRDIIADLDSLLPAASQVALIADANTWQAAGAAVFAALAGRRVVPIVLPEPKATTDVVAHVLGHLEGADLVLVVGSGTLNDVTKAAAHRACLPYAVLGTAASMNGYVTATASLLDAGHKVSAPANPPVAALFDLDLLAAAPPRLARAGLGDALCRTTVQTDAWLAGRVRGDFYEDEAFAMQRPAETRLLSDPPAAVATPDGLCLLLEQLLLGGFAMLRWGSSAPASQGEHAISHALEMRQGEAVTALHGEQIAVASCLMAALQDQLFAGPPPRLCASNASWWARAALLAGEEQTSQRALEAKALDGPAADLLCRSIATHWSAWRRERAAFAVPARDLRAALAAAGCVTEPHELAIPLGAFDNAVAAAPAVRERWGCLDLKAHVHPTYSIST